MEINCDFNTPLTWENIPPESKLDIWQYSEAVCEFENTELELITNTTTEANFYLKKSISYGDFLIIVFLMIFLIFGIMKFFINFIIKTYGD